MTHCCWLEVASKLSANVGSATLTTVAVSCATADPVTVVTMM